MEMNLIYHRAHHFSQTTGGCFEDLVQEGAVACLEAELSYDPTKHTKLSTWIWWSIERRMRVFCEREARTPHYFAEPPDLPDNRDVIEFLDFMDSIPHDVQIVYSLVLSDPKEFAGRNPYECHRMMKETLRGIGWTIDRAHEAIQDAKYWINNTSPTLTRSAQTKATT